MIYKGRNLNWKPSRPELFGPKYFMLNEPAYDLPDAVDLRPMCAPIKDQGQFGACSGFSSSVATEFLELIEIRNNLAPEKAGLEFDFNDFDPVSPMFIYNNERLFEGVDLSNDAGATTLADACRCLLEKGICKESTFPYTPENLLLVPPQAAYAEAANHKVPVKYQLIQTANNLMSCLASGFPFIFGISVYDSFMTEDVALSGVVPFPTVLDRPVGGHALCCVGYKLNEYWMFQNSWGLGWGVKGFGYLPWDYLLEPNLGGDLFTLRYKAGI